MGAGGARGIKRIEQAVEELGVKPPQVSTRAVCEEWLALRKEATEMLELRKQLAKRQEELTGVTAACVDAQAAAPAGAAAAKVFQEIGLPDTPQREDPRGSPGTRRAAHRHPTGQARSEAKDAGAIR